VDGAALVFGIPSADHKIRKNHNASVKLNAVSAIPYILHNKPSLTEPGTVLDFLDCSVAELHHFYTAPDPGEFLMRFGYPKRVPFPPTFGIWLEIVTNVNGKSKKLLQYCEILNNPPMMNIKDWSRSCPIRRRIALRLGLHQCVGAPCGSGSATL
jgi:hypothetical protein